jgi:hypothetical protein
MACLMSIVNMILNLDSRWVDRVDIGNFVILVELLWRLNIWELWGHIVVQVDIGLYIDLMFDCM